MERYTLVTSWIKTAGNGAKKNTPWNYHGMSNFTGGAEGIRTLDTVAGIPHFQCGALDQLCDVSRLKIILRQIQIRPANRHRRPQHRYRNLLSKHFPIRHQFHATSDLRW